MPRRVVQAVRHVGFEDLGSFAAPLRAAGFRIDYVEAGSPGAVAALDPLAADLLVVLGGPIGAHEADRYPVVGDETALLRARLEADRPTLGICLGAQLMAAALGARIVPGAAREIGFAALSLTPTGCAGPLAALDGVAVLHWHGDSFALPDGCALLASTPRCRQQAFSRGGNVLGLQFHPELAADRFEHWLIGHAAELARGGIAPQTLRAEAARHAGPLQAAAVRLLGAWLEGVRF